VVLLYVSIVVGFSVPLPGSMTVPLPGSMIVAFGSIGMIESVTSTQTVSL
jgi:hypothetical protein